VLVLYFSFICLLSPVGVDNYEVENGPFYNEAQLAGVNTFYI
jgi:hypothetical protein